AACRTRSWRTEMLSSERGMRAALILLVVFASEAHAHGRSTSTSSWQLDANGASVLVRVQMADLPHVLPETDDASPEMLATSPALQRAVGDYLLEHVTLRAGDAACRPAGPPLAVPSQDPTRAAYQCRLDCPQVGALQVRIDLFLAAVPDHLHLARFTTREGHPFERVFVLDSETQALGGDTAATPAATGFRDYLALGVEHI